MSNDLARQLKIKLGSCVRLRKEIASYEREAIQQEARVNKMRAENQDEAEIRKQEEVLEESRSMIPNSLERLKQAQTTLKEQMDLILESDHAAQIQESEDWKAAEGQVADL